MRACAAVRRLDEMSGPPKDIRINNPALQGKDFTRTVVPATGAGPARSMGAGAGSASAAAPSLALPLLSGTKAIFTAAQPPPPAHLPQKGDTVGKGSGKHKGKAAPPQPPYKVPPPITSVGSAAGVRHVSLDPDTPPLGPATAALQPPPLHTSIRQQYGGSGEGSASAAGPSEPIRMHVPSAGIDDLEWIGQPDPPGVRLPPHAWNAYISKVWRRHLHEAVRMLCVVFDNPMWHNVS